MAKIVGEVTVRILDLDYVKDFVEGLVAIVKEYEESPLSPSGAMVKIRKNLKDLQEAANKESTNAERDREKWIKAAKTLKGMCANNISCSGCIFNDCPGSPCCWKLEEAPSDEDNQV